jgi:AmmeMemoRadiSam system protein B
MMNVRQPVVAGQFYPADANELHAMVTAFLDSAKTTSLIPKALIVPHAGYIYSGTIAATGYAHLANIRAKIKRVVLLGPSHFVGVRGLATSSADAFATPLGEVPLDKQGLTKILDLPQVKIFDEAHAREHSLEVQLPFLQVLLDDFSLIPLGVGSATPEEIGKVLQALWGAEETLIVISSDLSHYHRYEVAKRLDEKTSRAIETLQLEEIDYDQACGQHSIKGLLHVARVLGLRAQTVDLRNSGNTAGSRDSVVGYGAYVLFSAETRTQ